MAASKISIEERQHIDNKQPIVLPEPGHETIAELMPVTITTPEGDVFEIADTPLNLGRATALASEQTLRKFWDNPQEDEAK